VSDGHIHSRVGDRSGRVFRRSLDFGKYRAVLLLMDEHETLAGSTIVGLARRANR
jgi:hypothetical protein